MQSGTLSEVGERREEPIPLRHQGWAKRAFDILFAASGLIALSPILAVCAVLAKSQSEGSVLFRGPRVGRCGRRFTMLKFRTMVHDAPKIGAGVTSSTDARITPVGKFLRRTKFDELPNLWNVLNGTMSFVGPRPELPKFVAHYDERQLAVLSVRPGITGPTQLRFRNEEELLANQPDPEAYYVSTILPEKLDSDLRYIETRSFWRDVGYVIQTLALVISRLLTAPFRDSRRRSKRVRP